MSDSVHEVNRQWFLHQPPERQDEIIAPAEFDRMVGPHFVAAPKGEQRDARERAVQSHLLSWEVCPVYAASTQTGPLDNETLKRLAKANPPPPEWYEGETS